MKFLGAEDVQTLPTIAGSLKVIQLGRPAAPTVTPNVVGSTTYSYSIVAVDAQGFATNASVTTTIANGPATLDASDTITVTWTAPPGTAFVFLMRTAGGASQGAVASGGVALQLAGSSFTDAGAPTVVYNPPATDQTGSIQGAAYVSGQNLFASNNAFIQANIPVPGTLNKQAPAATFNTLSITVPTTIFSTPVTAGALSTTGCVRVTIFGDALGNSSTHTWTFAITFGGVTVWKDVTTTVGASASRYPWRLEFILANNGVTGSQILGGSLMMGAQAAATFGEGDIGAAAKFANPIYSSCNVDTTATQTIAVTAMPSVSNVAIEITVKYALTEIMP